MKRKFFRAIARVDFVCLLFGMLAALYGQALYGKPAQVGAASSQYQCEEPCFALFLPDDQWLGLHPGCTGTAFASDCDAIPELEIDGSDCVPAIGTVTVGYIMVGDGDGWRYVYGAYAKNGSIEIVLIEAL